MRQCTFPLSCWSFVLCFLSAGFFSCSDRIKEIPIEEFQPRFRNLKNGEPLQLLAYGGGMKTTKDIVYYSQFLAVVKNTGDTIRILAPLISTLNSGSADGATHAMVVEYNGTNAEEGAIYQPLDSNSRLFFQTEELEKLGQNEEISSDRIKILQGQINKKQLVVADQKLDFSTDFRIPSVVGVLQFNGRPW